MVDCGQCRSRQQLQRCETRLHLRATDGCTVTTYAGVHGGCMGCDSTGYELADRGHRKGCRSPYANEPPRPPEWRAKKRREEADKLRARIKTLEVEAELLESGREVQSYT